MSLDLSRSSSGKDFFFQTANQLFDEVDAHIIYLQDFHDSLEVEYLQEVFDQFENNLYEIGSWYNDVLQYYDNEYYNYVNRSERRQQQVVTIVRRATDAAYAFQISAENYNRSHCRRSVQDLIIAIRNLKSMIETDLKIRGKNNEE